MTKTRQIVRLSHDAILLRERRVQGGLRESLYLQSQAKCPFILRTCNNNFIPLTTAAAHAWLTREVAK